MVSFHCSQWLWSKKTDRIVWVLGLGFVNTKEITLSLSRSYLLNSHKTLKADSMNWHRLAREPNAFCLWHSFFTLHCIRKRSLSRKKDAFVWELEVFCCSVVYSSLYCKCPRTQAQTEWGMISNSSAEVTCWPAEGGMDWCIWKCHMERFTKLSTALIAWQQSCFFLFSVVFSK